MILGFETSLEKRGLSILLLKLHPDIAKQIGSMKSANSASLRAGFSMVVAYQNC
jgi:hypothetical protein